jgi:6-phospho-beta-glucosidase
VRAAAVALEPGLAGRVETTTDLDAAIGGADAVIVQLRAGGLAARAHDERFPLGAGIPGDEGLGPGGLAAAWRAWPAVRAVLAAVAQRAPRAHVAILTAPLGILVRCALDAFPALDVVGLCELPAVVLDGIGAALGTQRVGFSYAGVNHLGWFTALSAQADDAERPALRAGGDGERTSTAHAGDCGLERYAATRDGGAYPGADVIRRWSGVPLPYVRLIDERETVVAAQRAADRAGTARGVVLAQIADAAYDAFETGDAATVGAALARRPAPWYARAVAPWVRAHLDRASDDVFFLTARNAGYLPRLDGDAVVEMPYRVRGGELVADRGPAELPGAIERALSALVAYETFASRAVAARDEAGIAQALALHPWVAQAAVADAGIVERLASGVLDGDDAIASATVSA